MRCTHLLFGLPDPAGMAKPCLLAPANCPGFGSSCTLSSGVTFLSLQTCRVAEQSELTQPIFDPLLGLQLLSSRVPALISLIGTPLGFKIACTVAEMLGWM